jgi:uncharacterized protein (DUF952 family)
MNTIYKIFRVAEWDAAREGTVFHGSPDDVRDGLIHFSTAEQLRETAEKHFAAERAVILAIVDADALGEHLKWEISRGGAQFPHLYASLPLKAVARTTRLSRDEKGRYIFPDDIP